MPNPPLPRRHPGRAGRAGRAALPLILVGTVAVVVGLDAGASAVASAVETRLVVIAAVALALGIGFAAWAVQLTVREWEYASGPEHRPRGAGLRVRAQRWEAAATVLGAGALTVGAAFTGNHFVKHGGVSYAIGFGASVGALAVLIWWTGPRYLTAWEVSDKDKLEWWRISAHSNAVGSVAVFLALIGLAAGIGVVVVEPRAATRPSVTRADATPIVVAALSPSDRATLEKLRDRLADSRRPAERRFAGALTGLLAGTGGALGGFLAAARTVPVAAAQALAPVVGALARAGLRSGLGGATFKPTFKTTVMVDGPKFSLGGVSFKPHIDVHISRPNPPDDNGASEGGGRDSPPGGDDRTKKTRTLPSTH